MWLNQNKLLKLSLFHSFPQSVLMHKKNCFLRSELNRDNRVIKVHCTFCTTN